VSGRDAWELGQGVPLCGRKGSPDGSWGTCGESGTIWSRSQIPNTWTAGWIYATFVHKVPRPSLIRVCKNDTFTKTELLKSVSEFCGQKFTWYSAEGGTEFIIIIEAVIVIILL
jgi:hypothetical protein